MLEHAATLVSIASTDRTLEPIKQMLLETLGDAVEIKRALESAQALVAKMHEAAVGEVTGPHRGVVEDVQDLRTAFDVVATSDTFFRKATHDALSRIETLEREIDVAKALMKKYASSPDHADYHAAFCALRVWALEE